MSRETDLLKQAIKRDIDSVPGLAGYAQRVLGSDNPSKETLSAIIAAVNQAKYEYESSEEESETESGTRSSQADTKQNTPTTEPAESETGDPDSPSQTVDDELIEKAEALLNETQEGSAEESRHSDPANSDDPDTEFPTDSLF